MGRRPRDGGCGGRVRRRPEVLCPGIHPPALGDSASPRGRNHGDHRHLAAVQYSYPANGGKTLVGHAYLTRDDALDDPDYVYAKSHPTIPIVVDPADWKTSDVNLNDRVFTGDPLRAMLLMIGITAVALIVGFGMVYGIIFLSYRKLLRPAAAKVS